MAKLICIISIISLLFACSPPKAKPSTELEKSYLLADSIHFDHSVINGLTKRKLGGFRRKSANLENQDIKFQELPKALQSDALEFDYAGKDAKAFVIQFKNAYREKGYLIFVSQDNFNRAPDKITVIKSNDQFDILRFMATNGINYDINTDSLITRLKTWNNKYPFDIIGADGDWVEARFTSPPSSFAVFAKEVYAFCPDVVDQGTNTVQALGDEMESFNMLYLWWD